MKKERKFHIHKLFREQKSEKERRNFSFKKREIFFCVFLKNELGKERRIFFRKLN